MLDADKFITELQTRGFSLTVTNRNKIAVAPVSRLTDEQRALLTLYKAQIIKRLSPSCPNCGAQCSQDTRADDSRIWFCPLGCGTVKAANNKTSGSTTATFAERKAAIIAALDAMPDDARQILIDRLNCCSTDESNRILSELI